MKSRTRKFIREIAEAAIVVAGIIGMIAVGAMLALASCCQPWEVGL